MKKLKLKAKVGGVLTDKDIRQIDGFILARFPDGVFSSKEILEIARPQNSPIHKFFTWDDSIAAEQYRIVQARNLIGSILVEIEGEDVRKYVGNVYLEEEDRRVYMETSTAAKDKELWAQVLKKALQEITGWQERYRKFKQLAPIFQSISQVRKKTKL